MKRISAAIVTLIFALCLFTTTAAPVYAASVKKVSNFKATATPTTVTLTWNKTAGATGYEVQQYVSKKWKTIKTIKKAKTKTLTVKKLKANKTYKFRIRAVKKNKKGAYVTVSVKTVTPKVTGLTITSAGLKSAKLTWTKVKGATGYEIQRQVNGKWKKVKTLKKKTTVTIKNLPAASASTFRVRAYTSVNGKKYYGKYSAKQTVTTAVKAMGTVSVNSVTSNSVTVSWKKVAYVSGYQIQKLEGGKWVDVKSVGSGVTQYTVTGLSALTNHQIRVRAYQKSGGKTYYNNWVTVSGTTTLGAASSLAYSNLTATSVKLTWKAADGAKGYYIQNNGKTISTVTTNSATINLSPATSYKITVVPYSGSTTGSATNAVSFTSACAKVTGTSAKVTDSTVAVSWAKVAGATGYQLQYCKNGGSWSSALSTTSNSYTVSNLLSNTDYKFRVRALNKNGNTVQYGEYSADLSAKTSGCSSVAVNASTATISWKAVSGAAKYVVQFYNTETSAWEDKATVTSTSYTDSSLAEEKAGLYRVLAYNSANKIIYTSEGFTAATTGYTVSQDDYKVTISWPAVSGASGYKVVRSTQTGWEDIDQLNASTRSVTAYLAPGMVHEYEIYAVVGSADQTTANFAVEAPAMDLNDKSDSGVNSQLLYLVEAINRSKFDHTHNTVININSSIVSSIDSLAVGSSSAAADAAFLLGAAALRGTGCTYSDGYLKWADPSAVAKLCDYINSEATTEEEKMDQTERIEDSSVITFNKGYARGTADDGTNHWLYRVFEPTDTDNYIAELYNANSPSAWKNGFSSVNTTKTSNGYKIVATLKKETVSTYHDGFMSTFTSTASGMFEGMQVKSSSVGATTLTAEIDNECRLLSYTIDSPYQNSFGLETEISEGGIAIIMDMSMSGSMHYEYTFTRTN